MNWTDILYYLGWLLFAPGLVVGVWRLSVGPTTLDRMVAFDLLTISVVALMVNLSIRERSTDYMELIIIVTALSFFSTVAFFYYLSQLPAVEGELSVQEEND
jgi:multisubunit Na+/H+ antiporter MnhF subunit